MARPVRESIDDRWQVSPRRADGSSARSGAHIGPLQVTPTRVILLIALVGSLAYLAYALVLVRDTSAIPMLSSGAFVLGLVFLALGVAGAVGMNRASRERRDGNALLLGLGGGLSVLIALFCFAGAAVLALVLQRV